jgi:hypothetical protein
VIGLGPKRFASNVSPHARKRWRGLNRWNEMAGFLFEIFRQAPLNQFNRC